MDFASPVNCDGGIEKLRSQRRSALLGEDTGAQGAVSNNTRQRLVCRWPHLHEERPDVRGVARPSLEQDFLETQLKVLHLNEDAQLQRGGVSLGLAFCERRSGRA